jgi:poly(hydroxyalkanoate) granule-associated protein
MVKRLKDIADSSGDSKLGDTIRDSAQQIWLAGLGAFAKAQEEGVKVFDALVQEGKGLEEKTRATTRERVGGMAEQMNKATAAASAKTNAAWDRIEQVFEDRVARSLKSLGVPTDRDVGSLTRQIEELSAEVRALRSARSNASTARKSTGSTAGTGARKTAAKKSTATRTAGRKSASKRSTS